MDDTERSQPPTPEEFIESLRDVSEGHLLEDGSPNPENTREEINNKLMLIVLRKRQYDNDVIKTALKTLRDLYPQEENYLRKKVEESSSLSQYYGVFEEEEN